MKLAILAGELGAALVEDAREDDVSAEAGARAAGRMLGEVWCGVVNGRTDGSEDKTGRVVRDTIFLRQVPGKNWGANEANPPSRRIMRTMPSAILVRWQDRPRFFAWRLFFIRLARERSVVAA
jgi:hypothetical protein